MRNPVQLETIVEEMGFSLDESTAFLNNETGEIVWVTSEELNAVEETEALEDLPEWQQKELEFAFDIVENPEKYQRLPDKYEIDEYRIMENFCLNVEDDYKRGTLIKIIKRKGAFRRFKVQADKFGIIHEWYSFRDKCYKETAKEWCESFGIE
ncbi:UPF0158 family protein [Neobacillus mesonae]|nr:UPF0158 family protein [Neobacillus mesonae]